MKTILTISITLIIAILSSVFYISSSTATQNANILANQKHIEALDKKKISVELAIEKFGNMENMIEKIYVKLNKIEVKLETLDKIEAKVEKLELEEIKDKLEKIENKLNNKGE